MKGSHVKLCQKLEIVSYFQKKAIFSFYFIYSKKQEFIFKNHNSDDNINANVVLTLVKIEITLWVVVSKKLT